MSSASRQIACFACHHEFDYEGNPADDEIIECPACGVKGSFQFMRNARLKQESDPGESFPLKNGNEVFFQEMKAVHPSLDIAGDILYVTKLLPGKFGVYDRNNNYIGKQDDMRNFTITSDREIFECTFNEFKLRGLFPRIPDSDIESGWSGRSVGNFIKNGATVNPAEIFAKCRGRFDYYMDFSELKGASTYCALYTILSYFYPLFNAVPYTKLSGLKGAAKTKLGLIFACMGFNSLLAVSMTPAVLFRTIQDTRGLMIIDEGENYQVADELRVEIISILNSGYQSTGTVSRMNMDSRKKKREKFSTFGPKIIVSINAMIDTLNDRAYEILLLKTLDATKGNRQVNPQDKEMAHIRDELYILLMTRWKEVREIASEIASDESLVGREFDKAKPLLVLAEFIDRHLPEKQRYVKQELTDFIKVQQKEKESDASDSMEALVIQELKEEAKRFLGAGDEIDAEGNVVYDKKAMNRRIPIQLKILAMSVAIEEGHDHQSWKPASRMRTGPPCSPSGSDTQRRPKFRFVRSIGGVPAVLSLSWH